MFHVKRAQTFQTLLGHTASAVKKILTLSQKTKPSSIFSASCNLHWAASSGMTMAGYLSDQPSTPLARPSADEDPG
jgi:hypothetical protein